ncbi:hypothetical protein [Nocardioides nitrophenolicus]|uniref:hypothetical protein n=1 Tax=Nocardioides nitrophenolicus TaxID=60489 RepID=UPI0019590496|nr:hypothetical protein [Nocardioides nitrophenolicus]MBM7515056.1 hypothetical protein [Nocardioides nitrophenolicus]
MRRLSRALAVAFVALAVLFTASPTPAQAAAEPDGSYTAAETPTEPNGLDRLEIRFQVAKNGRKVKGWLVTMNVVCGLDVRLIQQTMPTMKVKKSGRFGSVFAGTQPDGTTYRIEVGGKLVAKKRKVKDGTLSYQVGLCRRGTDPANPLRWAGRRTGR